MSNGSTFRPSALPWIILVLMIGVAVGATISLGSRCSLQSFDPLSVQCWIVVVLVLAPIVLLFEIVRRSVFVDVDYQGLTVKPLLRPGGRRVLFRDVTGLEYKEQRDKSGNTYERMTIRYGEGSHVRVSEFYLRGYRELKALVEERTEKYRSGEQTNG